MGSGIPRAQSRSAGLTLPEFFFIPGGVAPSHPCYGAACTKKRSFESTDQTGS